jgi:hypothetical protein
MLLLIDKIDVIVDCGQDEMKALQRLNTAYFMVGFLGFTTTWVLSLIAKILDKPELGTAADRMKALLRLVSPQYTFGQGLYDITTTYHGAGQMWQLKVSFAIAFGSVVSMLIVQHGQALTDNYCAYRWLAIP